MNWRGLASIILIAAAATSVGAQNLSAPPYRSQPENRLQQQAKNITVKVISGRTSGSGIIIGREGQTYTVLTNRHVLTPGDNYKLETPDGLVYQAGVSGKANLTGRDLALLQFRSRGPVYAVATLADSSQLGKQETVFAAGFTQETAAEDFTFLPGKVFLVLEKPLQQGYQVGYSNPVRKGMSGGPLLNGEGEVVAINGMHAYPLWGDPYIYEDGSRPSPALRQRMQQYSWGIPSNTFLQLTGQVATPVIPQFSPEYLW